MLRHLKLSVNVVHACMCKERRFYVNSTISAAVPLNTGVYAAARCLTGTIEYATMAQPLQPEALASTTPSTPSDVPSFHGADAYNYRAPAEVAASRLGLQAEFDPVDVSPGECVVHAQDCWHGSAPNVSSDRHRRALVVHFLRGDARFIDGHPLQVGGQRGTAAVYTGA